MNLFEVVNGYAMPSVHALMIDPFKRIWEQDTSPDKAYAIKIFTYTELMCSKRKSNPFATMEEEEKEKAIKKRVFGDADTLTDMDAMICCIEYKELLRASTPSYELLESAITGAYRMLKFLKEYNFSERTPNGAMVLKPGDVQKSLNTVPDTIKKLEEFRDKIDSEINEGIKMRGDREVGLFEE